MNNPSIQNLGWMNLYTKFKTNTIRILGTYENISRLTLLIILDSHNNKLDSTISEINKLNLCENSQIPEAVKLRTNLKEILPDADPVFLDLLGEEFALNHEDLNVVIENIATKKISYPKLNSYNDRLKRVNRINNVYNLLKSFNVENFLSMCPDPSNYFKPVIRSRLDIYYSDSVSYLGAR